MSDDPRPYHHGDLRQALIRAAVDRVAESGIDAVKVSSLARTVGVSSAAPFRHFASRQALLVAAAEEGAQRMLGAMTEAMADTSDPLERERSGAVAYVRFAATHPGYFRLVSDPTVLADSPTLQAMNEARSAQMEAVLGRAQPGDAVPEMVKRSAGMLAAQALVYGLACMVTDGSLGSISPEDAAALAYEVTGVLGEGLRGPPED